MPAGSQEATTLPANDVPSPKKNPLAAMTATSGCVAN